MAIEIDELIQLALKERASDIHLRCNEKPIFRIDGIIRILEMEPLKQEDLEVYTRKLLSEEQMSQFERNHEIDLAYEPAIHEKGVRLRVNIFTSCKCYGIAMRIINEHAFDLDSLGFPEYQLMKIKELLCRPRVLMLVVGPTGSGKSTTLAAMIDYINKNFKKHIITIEDPIEFIYQRKHCVITQRELGGDTPSFQQALAGALRQDPDVILVGEMRDLATMEAAVSAAETGHLVLSTLHTTGSVRTVDRIVDVFPENIKSFVRTQLSSNLICVISQVLCKRKDTVGRIPAFEIMIHSDAIGSLIRENKTFRITSELETNLQLGMIPLDTHLLQLYQQGKISDDEALSRALYPKELRDRMQSNPVQKKGLFSF